MSLHLNIWIIRRRDIFLVIKKRMTYRMTYKICHSLWVQEWNQNRMNSCSGYDLTGQIRFCLMFLFNIRCWLNIVIVAWQLFSIKRWFQFDIAGGHLWSCHHSFTWTAFSSLKTCIIYLCYQSFIQCVHITIVCDCNVELTPI